VGNEPAMFDDLLVANTRHQQSFRDSGMPGRAAKGLAVLTCIDSRIHPLDMLGLVPGDAKIIRNAGARVTDDVLRSLVLAVNLLGVDRVCVVQHTDCAMVGHTEEQMRTLVEDASGTDASEWTFFACTDQARTIHDDIAHIRACELLPSDLVIGGFVYDVRSGALVPADTPTD
jgi:carbonic anhydrase